MDTFTTPPGRTPPRTAELLDAVMAAWGRDTARVDLLLEELTDRHQAAAPAIEHRLAATIGNLWSRGWAPADVVHLAERALTRRHADVAAEHVVADGNRRMTHGQALHPRWRRQLVDLDDRSAASGTASATRLHREIELLCVLTRLPDVPPTMPAPGQAWSEAPPDSSVDAGLLARVRALLAKAESTEFEPEAHAFTAKAQQLMARHAIDEALLHSTGDVGAPAARRIHLTDPYASAKVSLLAEVAGANRCRVVYTRSFGWVTAFGYDADLDTLEVLATSLLTQATTAMVRHGEQRDFAGRSRTRSFRHAFLLGFAQRIGERLDAAAEEQVAETAGIDDRLLPVLAARDVEVRTAVAEAFPDLGRHTTSVTNGAGWAAGRVAGEHADLATTRPARLR